MLNLHEPIHIHRYTLRAKKPFSAFIPRTTVDGALVKIGEGYGCLQPWPELGDLPLERQISLLQKGGLTSHLERLRICCRLDGMARAAKRNEIAALVPPRSHFFDPGPGRTVKVKCGIDIELEAARVPGIEAASLRLDFNGRLDCGQVLEFVRRLDEATRKRIDFIEDPIAGGQSEWDWLQHRIPIDLASDRTPVRARVTVFKPACDNIPVSPGRVVFTTYLDHPLGQMFAAREAAAYYTANPQQAEVCGLATHLLFEPDAFIDAVKLDADGRLLPPPGFGFGFDQLLENLPWQKLN